MTSCVHRCCTLEHRRVHPKKFPVRPPTETMSDQTRRLLLPTLFGLVLLVPVGTRAQPASEAELPSPPNILWISAEDLSPRLGAYGDDLARTPHLDSLAAEGIRYARAFTTSGVCAPSRAAIITGMYQNSIGAHHMRTKHRGPGLPTPYAVVPPPYVKTFTEHLRAAGYYATNNAKEDYQLTATWEHGHPFTAWDESSEEAHWRNRPSDDQPFFSIFNLGVTHESQVFGPDDSTTTDPAAVEVPPYYPDTRDVREEIAHHYDNIAELDRQVGALLDQLEADGLADETIVVFWGDHGDGLPRAKRWLYDSGLRVPLIVRVPQPYREWAGIGPPGSVNEELISLMDLGPTMLSLADAPVPQHMHGRAFLGPQSQPEPDYVFAARDRIDSAYDMVRSARSRHFRYLRNFYPEKPYVLHVPYRNRTTIMQELFRLEAAGRLEGAERLWMRASRPPEELYDIRKDPHEVNNLADDPQYADVLRRMRQASNQWMKAIDDMGRVPETQMVRRFWPDMKQPTTDKPIIVPRRSTTLMQNVPDTTGGTFTGPLEVTIHSPTQGASVAYRRDGTKRWTLYTGPIRLEAGSTATIEAKAIRYGYKPSDVARAPFTVKRP